MNASHAIEGTANARARQFVESFESKHSGTDLFSFVRQIEGMLPHLPRVGASHHLWEDPLLFHQRAYLEFAPATVQKITPLPPRETGGPLARMDGFFLGLLGPSGPLPLALTEYILARSNGAPHPDRIAPTTSYQVSSHRRDSSLEDFLNVFNHRFISFLYRAWASSRKAVDFDRPPQAKFPGFFGSFVGLGQEHVRNRMDVAGEAVLFFAGHFANRSRHADGLASVISDYFGTQAEVVENVGHWLEVPASDRCLLGGSAASPLGLGVVLGARLWDRQLRFDLRIGPMSLAKYDALLPGGPTLEALRCLVKLYTNRELFCSATLILAKEDYPGSRLGRGTRLGFNTWLHSGNPSRDLDDLQIEIQ